MLISRYTREHAHTHIQSVRDNMFFEEYSILYIYVVFSASHSRLAWRCFWFIIYLCIYFFFDACVLLPTSLRFIMILFLSEPTRLADWTELCVDNSSSLKNNLCFIIFLFPSFIFVAVFVCIENTDNKWGWFGSFRFVVFFFGKESLSSSSPFVRAMLSRYMIIIIIYLFLYIFFSIICRHTENNRIRKNRIE